MYSGLKQKNKICKGCGYPKKIFSHGLCYDCAKKGYKPLRQKKEVHGMEVKLTERNAFLTSYLKCGGKNFFTDKKVDLVELKHWNFIHVLSKKQYPYFKYYYKNIVIGWLNHHKLIDQGKEIELQNWIKDHPEERWNEFFELRKELSKEYKEWIKNHKNEYKL